MDAPSPDGAAANVRQTVPAVRALFVVASVLVTLAGVQLFVLSESTDRYFSWTIGVPLTAAFLGAGYWASAPLEWLCGRERVWAKARPAVLGVFAFTVLTLAATLLHLELFHLGEEFSFSAQLVTWIWIAVYVLVPVLFAVFLYLQLRAPGGDPPRAHRLPLWMRATLAAQASVLVTLGAALFVTPRDAAPWWPWPLTPLTARAVGAWLVALAVIAVQVIWENDFDRTRPVWVSNVTLCVLQAAALARYPDAVDWSPEGGAYVVFLAGLLVTGVAGLVLGRRSATPAPEGRPGRRRNGAGLGSGRPASAQL